MIIYIDHEFHYETENLVRLFYPNEKITVIQGIPEIIEENAVISSVKDGEIYTAFSGESESCHFDDTDTKNIERKMAVCLYDVLVRVTGRKQPWGILTGVRPIKLFRRLSENGGKSYAKDYFMNELLVSDEKTNLSAVTEEYERKILALSKPRSFSLYISIPFCPSRCSYCSFVSQSIEKAKKLIEPYLELLCKEIEHTAEIAKECKLQLESVSTCKTA